MQSEYRTRQEPASWRVERKDQSTVAAVERIRKISDSQGQTWPELSGESP